MSEDKWYCPCNYCGECPIWLAAFNSPSLDTYDKVVEACEASGCPLVGQEVLNLDLV